jgi:HlyD family secretion protein
MKYLRWIAITAVGLCLVATLAIGWPALKTRGASAQQHYLTQAVDTGDIGRVVRASGALGAVNLVQVGTQVSGTLRKLYVDYNSTVQAGQLLAELDDTMLQADLSLANAQMLSAHTQLEAAQSKQRRARQLFSEGFYSGAELEDAESTLALAHAQRQQQHAAVARARANLAFAKIRSPVTGTVVSRDVSLGQTVAATLQTPVLFKIAQDLREMQIETNIAEADIGLVQEGQKVAFTVDSYPERVYEGVVQQVRNNHSIQQNVVTYTAVIATPNNDLSLRPGMTAYVAITVARRTGIVRVPNAALRYEPPKTPGHSGDVGDSRDNSDNREVSGKRWVWRLNANAQAEAVEVTLGLGDGRYTELLSGELHPGDALIIGEQLPSTFSGPKIF